MTAAPKLRKQPTNHSFRPYLDYCGSVWDPHTKLDKYTLERIQRKAAHFVIDKYNYEASVTEMLHKLEWKTLEERRAESRLLFLYKAVNNLIAFQEDKLPRPSSRRSSHDSSFIPFHTKMDCYKYSLIPRTTPEWNLLPACAKDAKSIDGFKVTCQFRC